VDKVSIDFGGDDKKKVSSSTLATAEPGFVRVLLFLRPRL
jgi:hypothetical protein